MLFEELLRSPPPLLMEDNRLGGTLGVREIAFLIQTV
jgi:hypothetical protein